MAHEEIIRAFQQMRQNVGNTSEQLHELQSQARFPHSASRLRTVIACAPCCALGTGT